MNSCWLSPPFFALQASLNYGKPDFNSASVFSEEGLHNTIRFDKYLQKVSLSLAVSYTISIRAIFQPYRIYLADRVMVILMSPQNFFDWSTSLAIAEILPRIRPCSWPILIHRVKDGRWP
jgi:hypothetical protein